MAILTEDCKATNEGKLVLYRLYETASRYNSVTPAFENITQEHRLSIVGEGGQRIVVAPEETECVAKVGKFEDPYQIFNEYLNWTKLIPEEAKHLFNPLKDWHEDQKWNVMPEAEEVGLSKFDYEDMVKEITLGCGLDMQDFHNENFGYVDGEPKMIDYGFRVRTVEESAQWDSRQELWEHQKEVLEQEWSMF